ncbi:MAG: SDR family oxidoreductase [Furfurilactobacillus sp.]|jgi:NADP-dependent 3-hydroxy acid dehydrogenase YdfG|uniref:SDR family oxidoreductase n=1 Tax=Furfurilactobacillus milii TaxID=2888272 RepID=A0ABT6DBW6_9LACO|nr:MULTISPECIES: SDR family oxidoreductase [Furfurilactobacillus]QLE67669.1 oxidoreductase short-chain dehydrogenase-reductase [Furfurilactobacillus rossiae]MCF6160479.1 SDR family oxidoreductase [Furfurilactobacillus milii]MCF6162711.1 SDR family oxidoreductase [Furfurilactobacillus milii]MCF6418280.1 SDR family oxidoreductase [Furfurilactobacillus milii]MCH4011798.1 SDR family oxidoreductase [Furfurilactobacillus sp.]
MENVRGKVVVITGASSGIGAKTATLLAQRGAKLVLAARREQALTELASQLTQTYQATVIYKVTDVTNAGAVQALLTFAKTQLGRVDVLFNNAGLMPVSMLRDGKLSEWEAMIDINLKGALYGIRAALPIMEAQHSGQIITTDSVAGHFVGAGSAVYSGTKFAMRAIMEGLRVEEVGKGIKSTLISPGHAQTALASTISDPELRAAVLKSESETGLTAEDVASAVVYAIDTPENVGINEVVLRSTEQRDY